MSSAIPDFITRCDAFCTKQEVTRTWLSKRLLQDTYRLDQLAKGEVDIGVRRLERAQADLTALELEMGGGRSSAPAECGAAV